MASTGCLFDPRQKQSPGPGESIGTERTLTLFLIRSLDFGGWGFTEPNAPLGTPCLFVICDQMVKLVLGRVSGKTQRRLLPERSCLR